MAEIYIPEAEQALLGAILVNNDAAARVIGLEPRHFGDPVHGRIYEQAMTAINAGKLASPVTLKFALQDDEGLQRLGGPAYLTRMAGAASSLGQTGEYATLIRDLWARREMVAALSRAQERVQASEGGALPDIAADLEQAVSASLLGSGSALAPRTFLRSATDAITEVAAAYRDGVVSGVRTGLTALDNALGSLRPGRVYIVAGRPSMGKTAVALNLALRVAQQGSSVAFASLEMPDVDLSLRVVSALLREQDIRVPYSQIERADLTEQQMRAVIEGAKAMADLPLNYLGIEHRELSRLMLGLRSTVRARGCKLVVIDYLQLIQVDGARSTFDRVSAASKACKVLARQLEVPVILLSQLSREIESRDDKRPQLSDLRASGEIEEDADVVIGCYRHEYYLARQKPQVIKGKDASAAIADWGVEMDIHRDRLELGLLKNRGGGLSTINLHCEIQHNHLSDPAGASAAQDGFEF